MKTIEEAIYFLLNFGTTDKIKDYLKEQGFDNKKSLVEDVYRAARCQTCPLALYFWKETGLRWNVAGVTIRRYGPDARMVEEVRLPAILRRVESDFDEEINDL